MDQGLPNAATQRVGKSKRAPIFRGTQEKTQGVTSTEQRAAAMPSCTEKASEPVETLLYVAVFAVLTPQGGQAERKSQVRQTSKKGSGKVTGSCCSVVPIHNQISWRATVSGDSLSSSCCQHSHGVLHCLSVTNPTHLRCKTWKAQVNDILNNGAWVTVSKRNVGAPTKYR